MPKRKHGNGPGGEPHRGNGRALVISGGGALGAYAVGLLKGLDRDYNFVSGISTGALIAPMAALKQWDKLSQAYANVNLENIFSISPFTAKGKIRYMHALKRLVMGKNCFGEMYHLPALIDQFYDYSTHSALLLSGKEVLVQTLNISHEPSLLELFTPQNASYEQFKEAMFASCCFAPVSNVAEISGKAGQYYVDGGFVETITIDAALERGFRQIDVIVLRPRYQERTTKQPKNIVDLGLRLFKAMRYDIVYENLNKAASLAAKCPDVEINVYYLPHELTKNAMYFDQKQMQSWLELGEQSARDPNILISY